MRGKHPPYSDPGADWSALDVLVRQEPAEEEDEEEDEDEGHGNEDEDDDDDGDDGYSE
jgi:hypothetical protein